MRRSSVSTTAATATVSKPVRRSASSASRRDLSPLCASKRKSAANGVNVNTAIATTATAEAYRGRFAPSPTGLLHLGSLLAATGSYLQARARGGTWLLRIEDLDTPRIVPGAADQILRTLEHFGFEWDGPVTRQSDRLDLYR